MFPQKCWKFRKEFSTKFCVCQKYAKFDKYAKPKIFMLITSKKCQISKIWHKNMPIGNTGFAPDRHSGV